MTPVLYRRTKQKEDSHRTEKGDITKGCERMEIGDMGMVALQFATGFYNLCKF